MAEISHNGIVRHSMEWGTDKSEFLCPQRRGIRFMRSRWYVECAMSRYDETYRIVLQNRRHDGNPSEPVPEFWATVFLEVDDQPCLSCVKMVSSARRRIWEFQADEILDFVPEFHLFFPFRVDCLFDDLSPAPSQSSAATINFFEPVPRPVTTTPPAVDAPAERPVEVEVPVELPPDLESLSLDLCNLLEKKDFPDVQLRCGDRAISAHRAILAARSEVFAAMFRNRMTESETGVVDVTDLDGRVLETFLKYVYTGKFPLLSDDLLPEMYAAGDKYAVHPLKKACSDRMVASMTQENCLSILKLADAHSDQGLKEAAVNYVVDHIELLKSDAWSEFNKEQPILALSVYQMFVERKHLDATASK